jgi:hypothetical protein
MCVLMLVPAQSAGLCWHGCADIDPAMSADVFVPANVLRSTSSIRTRIVALRLLAR